MRGVEAGPESRARSVGWILSEDQKNFFRTAGYTIKGRAGLPVGSSGFTHLIALCEGVLPDWGGGWAGGWVLR